MGLRATWDGQAEEWAAFARSPELDRLFWDFNLPLFLDLVPGAGRLTVDVGCGEGRLTAELATRGHRVVGVDGSPKMAGIAAQRREVDRLVNADAAAMPVRDGAADLVVAFMSLQDMDDVEQVIGECGRILEMGGRMCLVIAHPIRSAGGFESKDADAAFAVSDYYESRVWPWKTSHTGMTVAIPGMHRSLETYTTAIEEAGMLIERLREPRPPEAVVAGRASLQRWRRVPCFLHLRAVKA